MCMLLCPPPHLPRPPPQKKKIKKIKMQRQPILTFKYQQEFHPQADFFTPFVWSIIIESTPGFWPRRGMPLFSLDQVCAEYVPFR